MSAEATVAPVEIAPGITLGGADLPFFCGPCVVEGEEAALEAARVVADIARRLELKLVFKASYDKANRSSLDSFRGIGMERALAILQGIKEEFALPILTDVHEPGQCEPAAQVADILQIPAFLCRQTDLILAAARTGRAVNIKKGQFLAPDDMLKAVEKARSTGNERITVTERGFSFGYHNLVVDMRSFAMLHADGIPVIYDVTHSLQLPGGGKETGGARQYAEPLARAAVAAGADGIFMEIHPDPPNALSDHTTQLPPERAEGLIQSLLAIHGVLGGSVRDLNAT
jgi:2-dehydro-3-deoxyphosphooctonate aldolase (KDO 8-P synthase)